MSSVSMPEYSIASYFLHMHLLLSLMGSARTKSLEARVSNIHEMDPLMRKALVDKELTGHALTLMRRKEVPPIEEVLLTGGPVVDQLVTIHRPLYFKGAGRALEQERAGKKSYAQFHGKLKEFNNLKVRGHFSSEHFTYSSSPSRLSGHCTRFILAVIDSVEQHTLELRPVLIGDRIWGADDDDIVTLQKNVHRVFPEDITEFSKLASIDASDWDIGRLREVPERLVKEWFAELFNERNIQKDWGGETSDLFTTHLHVKGRRMAGAFLLKGPAKFHQLTVKDLGVNGDQIVRLFSEPADVHVVQHCHYIRAEVLHHLDAFASRPYASSLYCALDGVDTLRIFVGYGLI